MLESVDINLACSLYSL